MRIKNDDFDNKLYSEIIVDCNGEEEQNSSWYYYVQDEMEFPFEADVALKKLEGGKETKKVKVIALSDDINVDRNFDLKVEVELGEYIVELSLAKLENIAESEVAAEIVAIWKYWIGA